MSRPDATADQPPAPHRSFWRRRLLDPIAALLTQGVTPDKIAATLATALTFGLFPFLGTTTTICLLVGLWFRMNQPILQTINQLLTPLHLVMILVYVRLGERIWGASTEDKFSVIDMLRAFDELTFREFFHRFGQAGLHALTAWTLTAPLLFCAVYYGTRPLLRRFVRRQTA
ncbi:MAG: DUF2062 domain-containing protein [Verrucomicrobiota bacterium]